MRVCIVGAGAIGGLLAGCLAPPRPQGSGLARGPPPAAVPPDGPAPLDPGGSGAGAPPAPAADDPAALGPQDVVVLAVKAHQIAAVADRLDALYQDDTLVLPLHNGVPWWFFQKFPGPFEGRRLESLDPDGTIERGIPADRVIGCIAYQAAERDKPGVIRLVEGDRLPVGELDGSRAERVTSLAHTLTAAGFTSRVVTDIRSQVWVKALGNLAMNPISALTGATLVGICQWPATRELAAQMMR